MTNILCMGNSPLATVTEGHQRNVLKTPSRRPSVPTTLTTTSGRHLLLTVRPGAAPSTRSSPPFENSRRANLREKSCRWRSREPQQPYPTRPLTTVAVARLACPASASSAISMPAVDVDSLLHKSSFAKSSQEELYSLWVFFYAMPFTRVWVTISLPRTLLSILTDLNNTAVWIVSIRPPISNSSRLLSKSLETVPSAPITTDITVTLMFHNYLSSLARSKYLTRFSLSSSFTLKIHYTASLGFFFFLIITRFGLLGLGDLLVTQNSREFYALHTLRRILVCAYTIW